MITIRMIAEACGVSPATISKALNGAPDLSERTRNMVLRKAKEMGYRPNAAAKALRTNRSYCFGIIYEEGSMFGLTHEFFSRILNSFLKRSQYLGYDVFFLGNQLGGQHVSYAEHAAYRNCDGIFVVSGPDDAARITGELKNTACPVACVDFSAENVIGIHSDNRQGMRDLVHCAYENGHRRIAFLHGQDTPVTRARIDSFRSCCAELSIDVPEEYVVSALYHDPEVCQAALRKVLDLPEPPTCVLFPDDVSFMGAINEFVSRGMAVPRDISAMGYDGLNITQYVHPRLTTLKQDAEGIGVRAANVLVEQAKNGSKVKTDDILIPGELLPGETVRKIS